jgi:glucose/mannose-6-phosphate isomerase
MSTLNASSASMRRGIEELAHHVAEGMRLAAPVSTPYHRVFVCGMGGSAMAGEIISMMRDDVVIHWDYGIPKSATPQDLVVCISWSGMPTEVLSSYEAAQKQAIPLAVITTGGTLGSWARRDGTHLVSLPLAAPAPRLGAGLMTGALLGVLGMTHASTTVNAGALEARGRALAHDIGDRIPVFYTPYALRKVGGFFKTMINENAKHPAFAASFPSAAHNDIMGWAYSPQELVPVIVHNLPTIEHSPDISAFLAIMKEMRYTIPVVDLPDDSVLNTMLSGYILALWTSYHMALEAGVDPLTATWIDTFKELKKNVK